MVLHRRRFFEALQAAQAEGTGNSPLPTRVLGRTGRQVSILAMGCGSKFLAYKEEDEAIGAVHRALDLGITYFDTAVAYGNGLSETRLGVALRGRRKSIFIATKVDERGGDAARLTVEKSLKRLQTDHIDLVHIHSLTDAADLERIEASDGVLNALLRLKSEGVIGNVGITSHTDPEVLRIALERHPFDCTQMALNAALVGMKNGVGAMVVNPAIPTSFEKIALPTANRKQMGVIAMKVFAQDFLTDQAPADQLIRYSLSLPVAACVVGMPMPEMITQNVAIAKAFQPMPADEMKALGTSLAIHNKARIDHFFHSHTDA